MILKATGNGITSKTSVRFIPESTSGIDKEFDVYKLSSGSPDVPRAYTKCEDYKMAINSVPQVEGHETMPLYFEAGMDGTYTLEATNLETLNPETPVFLEDLSLDYVQDMRKNPNYSFGYSSGSIKKFNIHFKDLTGIDEMLAEAPAFHCLLSDGRLSVNYIGSSPFEGRSIIRVYNLAGQLMLITEAKNPHTEISFPGSNTIYIVHILYNQAKYATKVINQ